MLALLYLLATGGLRCHTGVFDEGRVLSVIADPAIDEASGLAASRRHHGIVYTINDSGGPNSVYAVNATSGETVATWTVLGAENCDWEDIAVGPGPRGYSYIYVGDIGGNSQKVCNTLYRFEEPPVLEDGVVTLNGKCRFRWDSKNCETMMVEPNGEVVLVSKVRPGETPKVYRVPRWSWNTNRIVTLGPGSPVTIPVLDSEGPVAGDISHDGKQILLKTYGKIYFWCRKPGDALETTLSGNPIEFPYISEPQGESVCWDSAGKNYYTLSEGSFQPIYKYKRLHNVGEILKRLR